MPAQQGPQLLLLALQRIAGAGDQQLVARGLQAVAQALGRFGEDRVGQVGQQGRHDVADPAGEQTGLLVGHVAGARQRGLDALTGFSRHAGRLAQVARDGDGGDTGRVGHLLQRDAAVPAPRLARRGIGKGSGCHRVILNGRCGVSFVC